MFSSQSTLNSVGRNAGISTTPSNYWYTEDNYPYVNLQPSGSTINATDIDTTNNILYLGGSFSRLYQHNANYHSIYDVSSSAFQIKSKNYGTNGSIYAYGLDTSNSILYVGGNFTSVTDNNDLTIDASYVAAWSIKNQRWTPLGRNKQNGLNGVCNALAVDITNQEVYVGGNFTKVSDASQIDQSANYVAKWKVSTGRWSQLGSSDVSYNNGLKAMCRSLVYDSKNTQLYVGGDFTKVRDSRGYDVSANRIAIWKDSQSKWNIFGTNGGSNGTNYVAGTSGRIFSSVYDSCKNYIYVTGDFTYVYDSTNLSLSANYIAYWDIKNEKWGRLGTAGSNGLSDSAFGTFQSSTYGSRTSGLAIDSSRQILYVGNLMTSVNDASGTLSNVKYIVSWNINTERWYRLGGSTTTNNGASGLCGSLAYDSRNNRLHVAGQCSIVYDTSNGAQTVYNIASWDVSNNCWLKLGSGLNDTVTSIAMDVSNNYLWVTGRFYQATDSSGTISVNSCVYWNLNNSRWYPLGTTTYNGFSLGLNTTATLALDSCNNMVYICTANSIQGGGVNSFYDASWSTTALVGNYMGAYNILTSRWQLLGNSTYNGIAGGTLRSIPMFALDISNSILYLSGNFTSTSDPTNTSQSVNYIAAWNIRTQTWSRLGTSTSNGITNNDNTESNGGAPMAMSLDSSCNLYVGSVGASVYDAGGTLSVNGVASWNPSTQRWSRLGVATSQAGNGLDGSCNAIVVDSSNNRVYVGGNFKRANDSSNTDLSVNNVAYWDITNSVWNTLGGTTSTKNGLDGSCNALAFDSSNNRLYVGGNFKKVSDASKSDQSANYVAFWDASTSLWGQVGAYDSSKNGVDASVNALAFDSCKNILYVGGYFSKAYDSSFTLASPLSTQYLATWNPTTKLWSRIGYSSTSRANIYGLSNFCRALTYDSSKRLVYVGGDHTTTCDSSNISIDASNIAYINLNTGNIYPLGSTSRNGTNDKVNGIKLDTTNNVLYVDGSFTTVYDSSNTSLSANYIAKYDVSNQSWSRLGSSSSNGLGGIGKALFYDNTNNAVYASGAFTAVRDSTTDSSKNFNYVAKWDVAKSAWSPLGSNGNGTNGTISVYAYHAANYRVFCGGSFTQVYDNSNTTLYARNVAVFDMITNTWSVLGASDVSYNNGLNLECRTLTYDTSNTQLYVGGDFTSVRDGRGSDISANRIAIWKPSTSQWSVMGTTTRNGLDGSCNALALDSSNSRLYVGGNFKKVNDTAQADQSANCVAYWDITNSLWKQLGGTSHTQNGLDGSCNALVLDSSYTRLYVGGNFKKVSDSVKRDQSANYIAYWDVSNSIWGKLGASDDSSNNGVKDIVRTLAYDNANAQVYVGGDFIEGRDGRSCDISMNRVAIWKPSTKLWSGMGSVASNGTNGIIASQKFDSSNNVLYVGGYFTEVYDTSNICLTVNNIAVWNIAKKTWSRLGDSSLNGVSGYGVYNNVYSLCLNKTKLYVGGAFNEVYDKSNNTLSNVGLMAEWDLTTQTWSRMGGGSTSTTNGTADEVHAMALDASNQVLYVGCNTRGGQLAYNVYDLSGTTTVGGIGAFNLSSQRWSRLGSSTSNGVRSFENAWVTLEFDNSNSSLYVGAAGGSTIGTVRDDRGIDISINSVARWDVPKQRWYGLGGHSSNGTNGQINAYAYDSSRNRMYVGGGFTRVFDLSNIWLQVNNVAAWDVAEKYWVSLGSSGTSNGVDASVNALAIDSSNSRLYVGGAFKRMSDASKADQSGNCVVYWDISNSLWGQLGGTTTATNGLNAQCKTLIYDGSNSQLYVGGEFTQTYDSRGTLYINRIAIWKPSTSQWTQIGNLGYNGTNGQILAYVYDSCKNVMYAGGTFTTVYDSSNIFGLSANRVAKWEIGTSIWTELGTSSSNGVDNSCNAFAMDTSNQILYVGGNFTNVYDSTGTLANTQKVAKWDVTGSTWSRLGNSTATTNGLTSTSSTTYCSALTYDSANSILYVGGSFTKVGDAGQADQSANNVAYWNISTSRWSNLGASDVSYNNGVNRECRTLIYDASNTQLYVGGDFTTVRDSRSVDISANKIAIWKPSLSKWYGFGTLGQNGTNGQILTYAYDSCKNVMYAGGTFTTVFDSSNITGLSTNRIAKWEFATSSWSRLGTSSSNGLAGDCNALAMDTSNQILYVGGDFTNVYDAAGTLANTQEVAKWTVETERWSRLGSTTSTTNGVSGYCNALLYDSLNSRLYVGGVFTTVGDAGASSIIANRVVYWNIETSRWVRFGTGTTSTNQGVSGQVYSLELDTSNNHLYVGGDINYAYHPSGNISIENIVRWNVLTSTWTALGNSSYNGTNGIVYSMKYDGNKNRLYVGGDFTKGASSTQYAGGGDSLKYIGYWNISANMWCPLGGSTSSTNGTNAAVYSLALDTSNNRLYAGGNFTTTSDENTASQSGNYVAYWDVSNTKWIQMGGTTNGTNALVSAIALDQSKNAFLGGNFTKSSTTSGDISANYGIIWTPSTNNWTNLGAGLYRNGLTDGSCNALALDSSNQRLYVGGSFTTVRDSSNVSLSANRIAYWDLNTSAWSQLGTTASNGTGGQVYSLALDTSNNRLYAGGNFTTTSDATTASQSGNYVAYWDVSNTKWIQMGGTTSTTNGTNALVTALTLDQSNNSFIGGNFTNASATSGNTYNNGIIWNSSTSSWTAIGTAIQNGLDGSCNAFALDSSNSRLYVGGNFKTVSDASQANQSANYIAYWDISNSLWKQLGTTDVSRNGLNDVCNVLLHDSSNSRLYVGGNFKKVSDASQSDQSANYIAYWDISNSLWKQLGTTDPSKNGLDGSCNALAYDNSNNRLYVGGSFKKVSDSSQIDQSANYVVYWDVSNSIWKQLGGTTSTRNGASDMVNALAQDVSKNVFAGGRFISVNDSAYNTYLANYNAFWSPSTQRWSRLGSIVSNGFGTGGISDYVFSLTIDTSNSILYGPWSSNVGNGYYDVSNSSPLAGKSLCAWDIKNECWFYMTGSSSTVNASYLYATKYDSVKQRVYLFFYNGRNISDPSNSSLKINGLAYYDIITKRIYPLGGAHNSTLTNGLLLYNGSTFTDATPYYTYACETDNSGNLYAFTSTSGISSSYNVACDNNQIQLFKSIAKWNATTDRWEVLGSNRLNGVDASCISMVYDNSNQELYVGGNFSNTTDTQNDYLPRNFKSPISKVAKWSVKNSRWTNIAGQRFDASNGTNGAIYASVYDSCKNIIYMGGNFTCVSDTSNGDMSANYVAAWDVSAQYWSRLGTAGNNGMNNVCSALAIDSSKQILYVGGNFTSVYDETYLDQSANYIAAWNISSQKWSLLGASESVNGLDALCNALALDSSNSLLYVGGNFLKVNDSSKADQSANYVAYWDISNSLWKKLGASNDSSNNGVKSTCRTLTYDQSNSQLYVGGDFTLVRDDRGFDFSANRIAIWKPYQNKWIGMGNLGSNGTNGTILAYVYDSCKNVIYAGGSFTRVFDSSNIILAANQIAKWDIATSQWSRLGSITQNGIDGSCNALAMDTSNQILYVGGTFNTVYDSSNTNTLTNTKRVAAWNAVTQSWSRLGSSSATTNGLTSTSAYCNALAYDSSNSRLYVGGNFTTVGDSSNADLSSNRVAYWNVSTSRWFRIGANDVSFNNGLNLECRTLVYDQSNSQLYVGGDFTTVRDGRGLDISTNRVAIWKPSTSKWLGMGTLGQNGTNGQILAYVYDSCKNVMYAGGSFTRVFDTSNIILGANRIAKWDVATSSWSILGTSTYNGLDGSCNALAMDTSNQILYAGGYFTTVYDSSNTNTLTNTQRVAKWDITTSSWSRLGSSTATTNGLTSTSAYCNALAYDSSNSRLYVGGNFTTVADAYNVGYSANHVAYWNVSTSNWSQLGNTTSTTNGLNLECRTLAYDTSNVQLYVGGDFTVVRDGRSLDISANKIAIWKPSQTKWYGFGNLGQNGTNGQISAYVYDSCKNVIYASGSFTSVFDSSNIILTANRIAKWDIATSSWSRLGTATYNGLDGSCNALAMDTSNQILYAGGYFTTVYDSSNTTLTNTQRLAAWSNNTSSWSRLGSSSATTNGLTSTGAFCNALAYDSSNRILYVGGNFTKVGDASYADFSANYVASWNVSTSRWSKLGASDVSYNNGLNLQCITLLYDQSNVQLYVGGDFTVVRDGRSLDISANKIAIWKPSQTKWYGFGNLGQNGTNGQISAYVYDSCKNVMYAGGSFTSVFDTSNIILSANRIAKWDIATSSWSILGTSTYNGLDGSCNALAMDTSNQILYAGGYFTTAYDSSNTNTLTNTQRLAAWNANTSSWTRLGSTTSTTNGLTSTSAFCNALAYDSSNSLLYVGGNFTKVGDASFADFSANNVASWNVSTIRWSKLGSTDGSANNGLKSMCRSLAYDSKNTQLYVGGDFTQVRDSRGYDISANRIAIWKDSQSIWNLFGGSSGSGNGLDGSCNAIAVDSSNNRIYVGGNFKKASDSSNTDLSVNCVAYWDITNSVWKTLGGTTNRTNGLDGSCNALAFDSSNNRLYVGGNFRKVSDSSKSDQSANYIAFWDASNSLWGQMGGSTSTTNGVDASVNAIALDSNRNVFVGGNFTKASLSTGDTSANKGIIWNPMTSSWTKLGAGLFQNGVIDLSVNALALDSSNQRLYVGGSFSRVRDSSNVSLTTNRIAYFNLNTSSWNALGSNTDSTKNGLDGSCNALAFDSSNNRLYVGGNFRKVHDTSKIDQSANYIVYWDASNSLWRQMGGSTTSTNGFDGSVNAIALDSNINVFIGGNFTKASLSTGDTSANKGIIWTPSTSKWTNLGAGLFQNGVIDLSVNALALDSSNQRLYVGGSFSRVRDSSNVSLTTNRIAYFSLNTSSWNALGSNTDSTKNGLDGSCNALAFDSSNNRLYVGGNFRKVHDTSKIDQSANYVAFWDASNSLWGQMGGYDVSKNGVDASVNALALDSNRNVFVGGNFTKASLSTGDTSANKGIIWTPSTSKWTNLGAGLYQNGVIDLSVNALALDETNQRLYVGGSFSRVRDSSNISLTTNRIAYFSLNTSSWNALGSNTDPSKNGLDGSCNALAFDQTNKRLYVGGNFRKVHDTSKIDQSANYIAFWDASNSLWGQMGGSTTSTNGFDGSVNAIALDSNRNVFVGGTFTKASLSTGDTSANNGVIWNPTTSKWINIGVDRNRCGFTDGSVNALALDETNQRLYVGGSFTRANDSSNSNLSTANIAYWDLNTSRWLGLGTTDSSKNGLNAICRTLKYNSTNSTLYAGGDFTKASDSTGYDLSANRMVAWNQTNSLWSPLGSAYRNANNGLNNSVYTISTAPNNQIFVGGTFTGGNDISGSITSNYGLIWNPSSYKWSKFGGYSGIVNDGSVNALAIDSSYTKLFIGGNFSRMSDNCGNSYTVNDGAIWNISSQTLSAMGAFNLNGLNFYPNVFAMDTYNNVLYMGGNFTSAYDASNSSSSIFAMYVIGYDITNNKWIQLGNEAFNGVTGEVTGLSYDQTNYILYVSGNYNRMFDGTNGLQSVNYIAAYNVYSKKWGRLGSSTYNGTIVAPNSIAFNGSSKLYVGGNFTSVYDTSNTTLTVKYMATWDTTTSTWSRVGANTTYNGVDASVNILQYNSVSNYLLTVGNFSNINDSANTKVRQVSTYATYKF